MKKMLQCAHLSSPRFVRSLQAIRVAQTNSSNGRSQRIRLGGLRTQMHRSLWVAYYLKLRCNSLREAPVVTWLQSQLTSISRHKTRRKLIRRDSKCSMAPTIRTNNRNSRGLEVIWQCPIAKITMISCRISRWAQPRSSAKWIIKGVAMMPQISLDLSLALIPTLTS